MSTPRQPTAPDAPRPDPMPRTADAPLRIGSIFNSEPPPRMKRAMGATAGSLAVHVLLVAFVMYLLTRPRPVQVVEVREIPS